MEYTKKREHSISSQNQSQNRRKKKRKNFIGWWGANSNCFHTDEVLHLETFLRKSALALWTHSVPLSPLMHPGPLFSPDFWLQVKVTPEMVVLDPRHGGLMCLRNNNRKAKKKMSKKNDSSCFGTMSITMWDHWANENCLSFFFFEGKTWFASQKYNANERMEWQNHNDYV